MADMLSMILPTYNEHENIENLINAIIKSTTIPTEIIVIDDSPNGYSQEIVNRLKEKNGNISLIKRDRRGLGSAVEHGISIASGNLVGWMDCDFSHPPALLPVMIEALSHNDAVIASRFVDGGRMINSTSRILASKLVNRFAQIMLSRSITDYTSGYIVAKKNVFIQVPVSPIIGEGWRWIINYGEFFISLMHRLNKHGYKIKEIPYIYLPRVKGKSKTSPNFKSLIKYGVVYGLSIFYLQLNDIVSEIKSHILSQKQ